MKNRNNNDLRFRAKHGTFAILFTFIVSSVFSQYTPTPVYQGKIGKTLNETQQWYPEQKKSVAGAPNVIYILIDDIGFGAASAFGGLIPTPTFDSLANHGLRYTNFHTNAVCSPTRAGLLTGRNSHSVHIGSNSPAGTPGYDRYMPFEKATIADILRENGYNTYAVGKWHLTPASDLTQAGPFNRWPTGRGFDHYYGFLGGATDQYHPQLWEDTRKVEIEDNNKTLLTTRITDKAIEFISEQKSVNPNKPFFLYYAPGATHSPHQVDKKWSAKFKGKFDQGWDKYREETLARQIKLGVVPPETRLPPSNPGVKKWDELSADEKKLVTRHFEVYAGFLAHTDYEVGRLINFLKEIGQLENTLIFLSIGDNGASKAGTSIGRIKDYGDVTDEQRLQRSLKDIDLIGTEYSNVDYPIGWSQATNTPFRYWKADANSEGGSHNPLIIFWPAKIQSPGIRTQYSHVIDITPTAIELVGAKVPGIINGYVQDPIQGTSLAYTLTNPGAASRHTVQYFEINGSRAIYKDGWKAGTLHARGQAFEKDKWELYKLDEDFNERNDLAAKFPEKLAELQELFDSEAWKYNIYPLKDGSETSPPAPNAFDGQERIVLYPGIAQLGDGPDLANRSFSIEADVEISAKGAEGVLFSNGGRSGGISLFVQDGKPQFVYNTGTEKYTITSDKALTPGKNVVKFNFHYSKQEKGGEGSLLVNGVKAGEGKFQKATLRGAEGISIGKDILTPVSDKYVSPYVFTGKLKSVTIDFGSALLGSIK